MRVLRPSLIRSGIAAAILAAVSATASGQKINAPAGADREAATPNPDEGRAREPRLRPLSVSVFVPKGKRIPPALEQYAKQHISLGGRRFTIPSTDQAGVRAALEAQDVHVELERPRVISPPTILNPFNLDARISHRVPQFEATFASQKGATMTAAVFDGGRIRATHVEFQQDGASRVTVRTTEPLNDHATHVAGTIAASGTHNSQATGMARAVKLLSYDFLGDDLARLEADGGQFQVSNHSYGPYSGWHPGGPFGNVWHWWGGRNNTEDPKFGKYTEQEAALDEILAGHGHLVTFVSAGNDRGEGQRGPVSQPVGHVAVVITPSGLQGFNSNRVRSRDDGATGLDTVTGLGLAKNAVCIGAVNDIPEGAAGSTIEATAFTAFGPGDDGRIKPDLVANGFVLFSTAETGDTDYAEMSGTSMASPTASGIGALLWEHFKAKKGRDPNSAEVKAVLIHTARDAGVAGPDPIYGWGSIDALQAGRVIASQAGEVIGDPAVNTVNTTTPKTYTLTPTGGPIRVTVAWIDPAGNPNPGGIDDPNPALVNDLNVLLTAPDGGTFLPYSLDLANIWNAANGQPNLARRDRQNRVDNVEVIDATAAAGTWTLEVKAHHLGGGATQSFALILSGLKVQ